MRRDGNSSVNMMEEYITKKAKYATKKTRGKKGKLLYPFLSKKPSVNEVAFQNGLAMRRQTALSQGNKDSGLVANRENHLYDSKYSFNNKK